MFFIMSFYQLLITKLEHNDDITKAQFERLHKHELLFLLDIIHIYENNENKQKLLSYLHMIKEILNLDASFSYHLI